MLKKKLNSIFLLAISFLSLIAAVSNGIIKTDNASWYSKVICALDNVSDSDIGKTILTVAETEYFDYILYSLPTAAKSEQENMFNSIMSLSGYKFGTENTAENQSPFDKFGFAGLTYTSYYGEWKYYSVDVCKDSDHANSSNYGEYYKDRKDPLNVWSERNSSQDVRTKQATHSRYWIAIKTLANNIFLSVSKLLLSVAIALLGFTFGDVGELLGITNDFSHSVFKTLYSNFFVPLQVAMIILTAIYLLYHGVIKRSIRTVLVAGIIQPFISIFIVSLILIKPDVLTWPNKISSFGQAIVVSALGQNATSSASEFCATETGLAEIKAGKLDGATKYMQSILGCRMWLEFGFKPWVQGQWGTSYDNLTDLNNINSTWVKDPEVKLGTTNSIKNWGLFQLSVQSGNHVPLDGENTSLINGLNKDWYRIVDALSNYDEETIKANSVSGSGGSSGGSVDVGGDWTQEGTEAYKQAKQIWDFFKDKGWSGAGIAGVLGNVYQESKFVMDIQEGGGHFGMKGKVHNGTIVTYPMPNDRGSPLGGGGVFQITPYTKYTESSIFDKCGWCGEGQSEYVWTAYDGAATSGGLAKTFVAHPDYIALTANAETPKDGAYGFFFVVENGLSKSAYYSNQGINAPARDAAAEKAYEVFGGKDVKFDKEKFDKAVSSSTSGSTSSSTRSSNGGLTTDVIKQVKSTPIEYWDAWVGNNQGGRFIQSLVSMFLTIFGSIPILYFALISAVFGLGLTLLTMIAPIFLLLGMWGGKGNRLMRDWLGLLVSTMLKKVITSFLVVITVILVTNMMTLINEVGFIKGSLATILIIFLMVKNKERILNTLGRVNFGTMNLSGFNRGLNIIKKGAVGAKDLAIVTASGAIGASKLSSDGKDILNGAGSGAKTFIQNKLATTETGRKANSTYQSQRKDLQAKNNTVAKVDKHEYNDHICINCGKPLYEGERVYITDNMTWLCENCAYIYGLDKLDEVILDNYSDDIVEIPDETIIMYNDEAISVKDPSYNDLRNEKVLTSFNFDKAKAKTVIEKSLLKAKADSEYIDNLSKNRKVIVDNPQVPLYLESHLDKQELLKALSNKDMNSYQRILGEAWERWYMTSLKSRSNLNEDEKLKETDDIKKFVNNVIQIERN